MEDRLFTESEIVKELGAVKKDVEALRRAGMPFIRASKTRRFYLLSGVLAWAAKNQVSTKEEPSEKV